MKKFHAVIQFFNSLPHKRTVCDYDVSTRAAALMSETQARALLCQVIRRSGIFLSNAGNLECLSDSSDSSLNAVDGNVLGSWYISYPKSKNTQVWQLLRSKPMLWGVQLGGRGTKSTQEAQSP